MAEELEKRVKPSYKYRTEDFDPLLWGINNYVERTANDINMDEITDGPKGVIKYFSHLAGLALFNLTMLTGCYYIDSYLVKLTRELIK